MCYSYKDFMDAGESVVMILQPLGNNNGPHVLTNKKIISISNNSPSFFSILPLNQIVHINYSAYRGEVEIQTSSIHCKLIINACEPNYNTSDCIKFSKEIAKLIG